MDEITFALVESFFRRCINQAVDKMEIESDKLGQRGPSSRRGTIFRLVY